MRFFTNCRTLDELKAEYRRLTKIHHPDLGGDAEIMKAVNNEYAEVFETLKNAYNAQADEAHQTTETPEEFIEIVNKLLKLAGWTLSFAAPGSGSVETPGNTKML